MKKVFPVILFYCLLTNSPAFTQDTLRLQKWSQLDHIVRDGFCHYTEGMTEDIRKQINEWYKTFDFSGPEYDCQYHFTYAVNLDSCGYIASCDSSDEHYGKKEITRFARGVGSIIKKSGWQVYNKAVLPDTTYLFKGLLFTIQLDCEPYALIFFDGSDAYIDHSVVCELQTDNGFFYFDGFQKGCDGSVSKKRQYKAKKHCKK